MDSRFRRNDSRCLASPSAALRAVPLPVPGRNGASRLDRHCRYATSRRVTPEPPDSLIPYDDIVQEALRAVVGRVLGEVEATGRLPGEHHFYITFKTGAAGVDIPKHLSERFPDEMTIVIQNRFWDLKVREDGFEVGLSFNQAPAKLFIPFSAITGFHDPAVDFALQFHARAEEADVDEHDQAENDPPVVEPVEDGSNVVSVDFKRKK
jgi:uncharacterized protein